VTSLVERELRSLDQESLVKVMMHPAQRETAADIAELIGGLRKCEQLSHLYELQHYLFGLVYQVEERRFQCARILELLKKRGRLPAKDVPVPPHYGEPTDPSAWELELYIYARLARQLRTIGDGLAWCCFGYDRRIILTLCRNNPAGPMYPKKGLPYELGRIEELWKQDGEFALHHDLTNCLRISDLTRFTTDRRAVLEEVKAPGTKQKKKQKNRAQTAVDAIMHGGQLPGGRDARLIQLNEPYVTNLEQLGDLIGLAKEHGCRGMKLSQGRAMVASSVPKVIDRWSADFTVADHVLSTTRARAIKRAGIETALHHINGYSADTASRSPIAAPWSIYPFDPVDCAAIVCDMLVFETIVSAAALVESMERVGLTGEVLLPLENGLMRNDIGVVQAHWRDNSLTWHAYGLNVLLYELAEPDTLARGTHEVLMMDNPPTEPVLVYANEARTWLPRIGAGPTIND
jgi:hypothetical protein